MSRQAPAGPIAGRFVMQAIIEKNIFGVNAATISIFETFDFESV